MPIHTSFAAIVAGVVATLIMDCGNLFGVAVHIAPPSPRPNGPDAIGRWVGWMARGRFAHNDILRTPPIRGEVVIGITCHYAIGIVLTLTYLVIMQWTRRAPGVFTCLLYGLLTTVFPWFLMFPALGAGPLGARVPHLTRTALWNHAWYGIGLFVATVVLHLG